MLEMRRPLFDVAGNVEHGSPRSAHETLVHRLHGTAERHGAKLEWLAQDFGHSLSFFIQCVVSLKPRRRRTAGRIPVAAATSDSSSEETNPRITETTPS